MTLAGVDTPTEANSVAGISISCMNGTIGELFVSSQTYQNNVLTKKLFPIQIFIYNCQTHYKTAITKPVPIELKAKNHGNRLSFFCRSFELLNILSDGEETWIDLHNPQGHTCVDVNECSQELVNSDGKLN